MSAESAVRAWIASRFPDCRVATETPADLEEQLPFIKVLSIGGPQTHTLRAEMFDIEAYSTTRPDARDLAENVVEALKFQMRGAVGAVEITDVGIILSPASRPHDNPAVRRYGATIRVSNRKQ